MKLYTTIALSLIVGATLIVAFHQAPRYRDPGWSHNVAFGDSNTFKRIRDENRTTESHLAEFGAGIVSLAVSLALGGLILRINSWSELRLLATPSRKWLIILLANLTLLGLLSAEWMSIVSDLDQGDYPSWADTPAIPFGEIVFAATVGVPLITVGLIACLWRAELPACLWSRPTGWWAWLGVLLISTLFVLQIPALAVAVRDGRAFEIPFQLLVFYWLLCGRAATAAHRGAPEPNR